MQAAAYRYCKIKRSTRILGNFLVREDLYRATLHAPHAPVAKRISYSYKVNITLPQAIAYTVRADAQYGAMMLLMAVLACRALFA